MKAGRRLRHQHTYPWTFAPHGDLFVVYNHNVDELFDRLDRHRGWRFASNQLLVKLQYAFRY